MPTNIGTQSINDTWMQQQYANWKTARIVTVPGITGGLADRFNNDPLILTVSEGMGYAMLLAVIFNDKATFDGLFKTVRARPSYGIQTYGGANGYMGAYLMDWQLYLDGTSAGGGWNAMDGDLDIAMALLMANRQWGSAGTFNYLQEGRNTITAIKTFNMRTDGTTNGVKNPGESRTSDYMLGHFRAFAVATGDTFWSITAVDRAIALLNGIQTSYAPNTGLIPDFIAGTDTAFAHPSAGTQAENGDGGANLHEDSYFWNACRDPWRLGTDYLLYGDSRTKTILDKLETFFKNLVNANAGDVTVIGTGYRLDGTQITGGNSGAFHAPIMVGAMCNSSYQLMLNSLYTWNTSHLTTGYFDGEIQLLSLVVATGNWWKP